MKARLEALAAAEGLAVTGWLHPEEGGTLFLLGHGGPEMWAAFRAAPEAADGAAHPLDRWSRRVISALAEAVGGAPVFPFDGPPYPPFFRWILKGEPTHSSALGMAIHEERGLWGGWRGAVRLAARIDLPPVVRGGNPCAPCPAPCRAACPVGAFSDAGYDAAACRDHLDAAAGAECRARGCLARRACPVGREFAHSDEQAAFHLEAFRVA